MRSGIIYVFFKMFIFYFVVVTPFILGFFFVSFFFRSRFLFIIFLKKDGIF